MTKKPLYLDKKRKNKNRIGINRNVLIATVEFENGYGDTVKLN